MIIKTSSTGTVNTPFNDSQIMLSIHLYEIKGVLQCYVAHAHKNYPP